jgi:CheY-like chemotaxis protein
LPQAWWNLLEQRHMGKHDGVRVLVVDDDEAIRDTIALALEDEGFTVLTAPDGARALDMLRRSPDPLVVLLDLMMPRLTGMEVLQTIAMDAHLATTHAYILVTANDKTLPLAFVNLLTKLDIPILAKPFDVHDLLRHVVRAVVRLGFTEPRLSTFG